MKNKFPSLSLLKEHYPELRPFYTQSWVYAGISAYFGQQDQFASLEFTDQISDLVIYDYRYLDGYKEGSKYHGLLYEGHVDYWAKQPVPDGSVLISGHQHFAQHKNYTSVGFDYWDHVIYNEFQSPALNYEINRSSVSDAMYDLVIPVGHLRSHRRKFLQALSNSRQDLTIVTGLQSVLDTDLTFSSLGIEVYFNKIGLSEYKFHHIAPSFYDTDSQRSLDHLPHKKMHSISRVNVVLETTAYNTEHPYLTEKTYKVLAQHRPFVIVGDTNILKKLKEQGFKTFDKYCDESYDTTSNIDIKVQQIVDASKQLVENCKKYPDEIDAICRHNQELFFSQQRLGKNLAKFGQTMLEIISKDTSC